MDRRLSLPMNFYWLLIGETLSSLGGTFGTMTNSFVLFQMTGSKTAMGTLWLIYLLPSLLVLLLVGPYLDRWNRTHTLILSHGIRGFIFLLPVVLWSLDQLLPWHLYIVSAISGIVQAVYAPTSLAMTPSLVAKEQLSKANALLDGSLRLTSMLGPILAGLMFAKWGPFLTWPCVIFAFFCGALFLTTITPPKKQRPPGNKQTWVEGIQSGFTYFYQQKILWWLALFLAVVQFGVGVLMVLNLPYILQELRGNSIIYGWFIATFPLGYVLGSYLLSHLKSGNLRRRMLGANVIGGLTFVALAIANHIGVAICIELIAGIAAPFFHVHSTTLFQRLIPQERLAQVFSLRLLIIRCIMPLGTFIGGILGDSWGTRTTLCFVGLIIVFVSLLGILLPYFRFLEVADDHSIEPATMQKKA
ncbi:Predicted arabinose efflux permease, MFS family [Marininema mesophilum]|uniref:Predicted arabinose efflux permease, MFS family n=1 Tax=Marininema mesophilum TaxID=1048340 RepID=A0A1H3BX59_9BACL|nr:MFS transporter [Marininema mesophilum]SDX46345.1 Predicted arabinose efflux permease, MFS family [Marininema mesophilum]